MTGCSSSLRARFYREGWRRRCWVPIVHDALASLTLLPNVPSQPIRMIADVQPVLECSEMLVPRIDNALRRLSARWNACGHSNKRLILFDFLRYESFHAPKSRHRFWEVEPLLLWEAHRGNIPPRIADDSLTVSSECVGSRAQYEK